MIKSMMAQVSWWRTLLFHRFFPGIALKRNLSRDKEAEIELCLLSALADPNRISIDVGANAGSYTGALIPFSKKVYAVEPHPRLARLLRAFPTDKVEVLEAVASAKAGEVLELEVSLSGPRESDALGHVASGVQATSSRRFAVNTIALDDFATDSVGFVKIDVEGHELDVIRGSQKLLKEQRPILLIESESRHCDGAPWVLFEELEKADYRGFYCHQTRLHPVSEFQIELQDEALLLGYDRRDQAQYVNNFIFLPEEMMTAKIVSRCTDLLRS